MKCYKVIVSITRTYWLDVDGVDEADAQNAATALALDIPDHFDTEDVAVVDIKEL